VLSPQAAQIQRMFSAIAPRYDFLNHFLSLQIDKRWRRQATGRLRPVLSSPSARCLDLCCGTADLALEMSRWGPAQIIGSDFTHSMLRFGQQKIVSISRPAIPLVEADALNLPFASGLFDGLAIAFGLRNLDNPAAGLQEMARVLKPGGQLVILEFSRPENPIVRTLFQFYFFKILPLIGKRISRHHHAYSYLPQSVSAFPSQPQLQALIEQNGFSDVGYCNLSGGIAAIHEARRSASPLA
jgi:demethylmenaquinone methyltransferase/2-methoxy-6-polyprenyl-1,4-benzoquinol methylase